jgi:hypothetical protein
LEAEPLPEKLIEILGIQEAKALQLWKADSLYTMLVPLNIRLLDFVEEGEDVKLFSKELLDKVVQKIKTTAIQIDLNGDTEFIGAAADKITDQIVVFVITEFGEPAYLVDSAHPTRPYVFRNMLGPELNEKISAIRLRFRIARPKARA